MAGQRKTQNRMEMRRIAEAAEKKEKTEEAGAEADGAETASGKTKTKKTAVKKKAVRKRTTKKKKLLSTRLRMVWGVFDNSNQKVATFPYTDRESADKKASDMTERGRGGPYFVQPVKEPIPLADEPEEEA